MAKKRAVEKQPKSGARLTVWETIHRCTSRGCNRTEHRICVEAPERPANDDWLTYRCPVTRRPRALVAITRPDVRLRLSLDPEALARTVGTWPAPALLESGPGRRAARR